MWAARAASTPTLTDAFGVRRIRLGVRLALEKLREAADWAARVIASQPPLAIQGTLRAIWAGQELTRSQALSMAYAYVSLGTSPASIQEGQKAFASKKRPPWKLR